METLRGNDSSLVRRSPERDMTARYKGNGTGHNVDETKTSATRDYSAISTVEHSMRTNIAASNLTDVCPQNPFQRDYTDPLIPCRMVRYAAAKRVFDMVFALALLAALAVPMLIVALLIKLTSRGPVFFKQVRVGRGGRHFWCYKFRSMCVDAESRKETLMHLNEANGPVFKIKHDPRVTPIGRFIRKFSLDELPQLFNVVRGEMSVVGPRPPLPSEVALYGPHERGRLSVHPGLTCLWQVSGRSNISFERWVELDLLYIDTMSFTNDIKIIAKTIPAVVTGHGAH